MPKKEYDPYSQKAYDDYQKSLEQERLENEAMRQKAYDTVVSGAKSVRNAIFGDPNANKGAGAMSNVEAQQMTKKRGGKIKAKHEWHGFKGGKTGKNRHGF